MMDMNLGSGQGSRWRNRASLEDRLFKYAVMGVAFLVLALLWSLVVKLSFDAQQSIEAFGLEFLTSSTWDPNRDL